MNTAVLAVESPILYSFRRCPYAMRARLALAYAVDAGAIRIAVRELVLRDKPAQMLAISPKGTVPVLQLPDADSPEGFKVIDESLDIMLWAIAQADPDGWGMDRNSVGENEGEDEGDTADASQFQQILALIDDCDNQFKPWLDKYKYADRHPEQDPGYYRQQAEQFIARLERQLADTGYLMADQLTLADMAILPFIRQFAHVDLPWFEQAHYPRVQAWLQAFKDSPLFLRIMRKRPLWPHSEPDAVLSVLPPDWL